MIGQIMIERLMHVMFWGYLDDAVWKVIAEASYFYRKLYAKEIMVEMMEKLEKEILVLLCKMEKSIPIGFFNPIQHLLALDATYGKAQRAVWNDMADIFISSAHVSYNCLIMLKL
jgi:hypothetical protein